MAEGRPIPGADCPINIAGLIIATILSDSLVFRSSTTTQADIEAVKALAPLAGIDDYQAFGEQMLDAKSDITGITAEELVVLDSKLVKGANAIDGKAILRVSVFETVLSDQVLEMAKEIGAACDSQLLKDQKEAEDAVGVLFFIIDIREGKAIYIPSSNEFATDLVLNGKFQMAEMDGKLTNPPQYASPALVERNGTQVIELPTVLSRKQQIMPALLVSLESTPYDGNMAEEVGCIKFGNGVIKCDGDIMVEADIDVESEEVNSDDSSSGYSVGHTVMMTGLLCVLLINIII